MAETFHHFLYLPKELRLQVWEQALIEARPSRCIILYKLRVVPFKQLISPLLLVNYESRTCAKAFYNFKLDIYAMPPLSNSQIKSLDKQEHWDRIPGIKKAVNGKIRGYTDTWVEEYFERRREEAEYRFDTDMDESFEEKWYRSIDRQERKYTVNLEEHWAEFVEEKLRVFGSESAGKVKTSRPIKGAFYISLEHDVFIDGYECGRHFYIDTASKIFGAELEQRPACHHISAMLDPATRDKVSTLVLVRPRDAIRARHCVFASDSQFDYTNQPCAFFHRGEDRFQQKAFPSVNSYFKLTPQSYNHTGILKQLIEADGPSLSRVLQQWVKKESSLHRKRTAEQAFRRMTGDSYPNNLKPADWARELMAHWHISDRGVTGK